MSASYKLLFQDKRQFIFEEAEETHTTAIITLIAGFIAGSLLGVYFASLNATTAGSILLAIGTYITILTSAFSIKSNPFSVLLIFVTSFTMVIGLIYISRITLEYLKESPFQIVFLYAGVFAIVAELVYLWSRLTWVEDPRMHQLIEIGRDDDIEHKEFKSDITVGSFFVWIFEIISFTILRIYYTCRGNYEFASKYPILIIESFSKWSESEKARKISITNETLKKVKVCVYHRHDYCCWVPVGGLTGGMFELDRGEELVFSPHWPAEFFRIKIFAHGVIDYELACQPCVSRGRRYAFIDVGKPITVMTHLASSVSIQQSSSEDDESFMHVFEPPSASSISTGLRRVTSSRANLSSIANSEDNSPSSSRGTPTKRGSFRNFVQTTDMTGKIAILNESTTEIKIIFYSINDHAFVRSIDSLKPTTPTCVIPRQEWKVFLYTEMESNEKKFCMRVKTGSMSLEIAYCTAYLAEAFIVRDPIVTM